MSRDGRFKHNLTFEYVMLDPYGKHYGGLAGAFRELAFTKKCLLKAKKRIRKRLETLTMDEGLRQITGT